MEKIFKTITTLACVFIITACRKDATQIEYTYHEAIGSTPGEWNPHILGYDLSYSVQSVATMGWVSMGMKANKDYTWLFEMADAITDVTNAFSQKEKYGIGETETNRVYQIKLNEEARWANGVKIDADSYIYSMKELLNYDLKNPRSSAYTDGIAAIANAKQYIYNGQNYYGYIPYGEEVDEADGHYTYHGMPVYYSLTETIPMLGASLKGFYDAEPERYTVDGEDIYKKLDTAKNEDGYALLTPTLLGYMKKFATILGNETFWIVLVCYQEHYSATWEDVGFLKVDDYTLDYVLKTSARVEDLYPAFATNFLVYEPLYEAGKADRGGQLATNYGTSVDTYMSYGPYQLSSFERDKQMVFVKNNNWYGYRDNKHNGMYQTTKIVYDVIPSHETELNSFLGGKIEKVLLNATDMKKYKFSDDLLKADESFIFYLSMNSNLAKLEALEIAAGNGSNKRVGAYSSFREALSYSINRLSFVTEGTAGSKVQFGLFNNLYFYDALNDPSSIYRTSEYGMRSIVDHYHVEYGEDKEYKTLQEAYQSITGYDLDKAKTLFQQTYLQMKEDGNYTDGQFIKLNCVASDQASLSEEKMTQQNLLNSYIDAATKDTGFEDKITIAFVTSANKTMDKDFRRGDIEMILTQKSGQETSPFNQIRKYIDNDSFVVPEIAAYNPAVETMTLTIHNEEVTKTILDWGKSINGSGAYVSSMETRVMILSKLENYLLDHFVDIPLYSRCNVYLNSKKINQGTTEYNLYYGFGGIPYITYNFNDAQWEDYVNRSRGEIYYG